MSRMQASWRMILVHAHHALSRHPEVAARKSTRPPQGDGTEVRGCAASSYAAAAALRAATIWSAVRPVISAM
jgi:hypothetical protein